MDNELNWTAGLAGMLTPICDHYSLDERITGVPDSALELFLTKFAAKTLEQQTCSCSNQKRTNLSQSYFM
eukprot:5957363-Amphidinium_carterae.3